MHGPGPPDAASRHFDPSATHPPVRPPHLPAPQDEQAAMAGLKERAARERRKALAVQVRGLPAVLRGLCTWGWDACVCMAGGGGESS